MKIFTGVVVGKKMDKTATVAVENVVVHPVYKKRYRRTKNYHVHDELGTKVGQKVQFVASRPYSKLKRWKITEIITNKKKSSKRKKKGAKK